MAQSVGYTKCQFINTLLAATPLIDAVSCGCEGFFLDFQLVGHCHLKGQLGHSFLPLQLACPFVLASIE